jgi:3'-5' exoribonuclease
MLIREVSDGTDLDQVLLVREIDKRTKRDGGEFLRLTLGDRSGQVVAMVWDGVGEVAPLVAAGQPVRVLGRYVVHPRYGPQVNLRALRPAEPGSYDLDDLLDGPLRSAEQMEDDLRQLVATVRQPHLAALLERVLGTRAPGWPAYRDAPAAKFYHQAYRHGLLEHCLTVGQAVGAISATFPGVDRDVAVTGALLHDIGKLEAYTTDPANIELTDDGRLQGEIALGYYRVRREIEEIPGFPPLLAKELLHIILAHHGTHEHGSPVLPATREATLVHMIDNLGGRLGSFDRLEKELRDGERWSGFDRALGGGAYFGRHEPLEEPERDAA